MKLIRGFALLAAILLILSSCSETVSDENTVNSNKRIYRMESGEALKFDNSYGMPVVVDPVNCITTALCSDPLCMHDTEECPFYDCQGCASDGVIMFFHRGFHHMTENGGFDGTEVLCTYDPRDGKVRTLCEYSGRILYGGVHDNTLYYYVASFFITVVEPDENSPASKTAGTGCEYRLFRADGISGEITELELEKEYGTDGGYVNTSDYPALLTFGEDCIYWMEYTDGQDVRYYRTDMDNRNGSTLFIGSNISTVYSGNYGYSVKAQSELIDPEAGRKEDNLITTYSILRTSLEDGSQTVVAEKLTTPAFIVTDRYIFTVDGTPSIKKGTEVLNEYRILRMKHDGSDVTEIAEGNQYPLMYQSSSGSGVFAGYYEDEENTCLALSFCSSDADREYSSDTLILDTNSGKFTVSSYVK